MFGADYNPEQWPRETWFADIELMRAAGVNLATVGVFSWSRLEPRPGKIDFGWLDKVIGLLTAADIAVDLATPTASPPPWMGHRWPETLAVNADGVRMSTGSRNHFCPSSVIYREHCRAIVTALAKRYGTHLGVEMWHLGNEFGQVCYCDSCAASFRIWLRARYGDLGALNEAWGTAFWSQGYSAWDEIVPPRMAPYLINPTQQLDYRRFASDLLFELFAEQRQIVVDHAPRVPITTNFMGFFPLVDYRSWAGEIDVISDDSYPDPTDPDSPANTALSHDLMRTLGGGRGWMLMEQASGAVNWRPHNPPKSSSRMRLDSLQAIAHGAGGSCFFQWRASRAGSERFHAALVPHAGPDTAAHRAVRAHGQELKAIADVLAEQPVAEVAMIFDWPSWWAAESDAMPSNRLRVLDQLRAWHRPLWNAGVLVDVCASTADLSQYRAVLVPQLFLVDDLALANLRGYVAQGGSLVLGPFSAVADENAQIRTGRFPVGLTDVVGISGEEWIPLADEGTASIWAERLRSDGAEVINAFEGGRLDGLPAITRNSFGEGSAWYVGTIPAEPALADLLRQVMIKSGVEVGLNQELPGIEAVRRGRYLFLLNHGRADQRFVLANPVRDLLAGTAHSGEVILAAGSVHIFVEQHRTDRGE